MKCPKCNGDCVITFSKVDKNGYFNDAFFMKECPVCHGTGEVEQTEEEYIQTCNHKELTEILFRMIVHGSVIRPDRQYISEWLKQPHTTKE